MDHKAYVIVGIIVGYLLRLLYQRYTKKLNSKDQFALLTSELSDLQRHCSANLKVLNEMKLSEGIPSRIHFEKLKIMESTILFSPKVYINISSKHISKIHRTRLEVRNINIEVDYVLSLLKSKTISKKLLTEYIDYLKGKNEHVVMKIKMRLENLKTGKEESENSNLPLPPKIIYE